MFTAIVKMKKREPVGFREGWAVGFNVGFLLGVAVGFAKIQRTSWKYYYFKEVSPNDYVEIRSGQRQTLTNLNNRVLTTFAVFIISSFFKIMIINIRGTNTLTLLIYFLSSETSLGIFLIKISRQS